jgi:hypothetical protein
MLIGSSRQCLDRSSAAWEGTDTAQSSLERWFHHRTRGFELFLAGFASPHRLLAVNQQSRVIGRVDCAARIVAPIPGFYADVLDVFRTTVSILHETHFADFFGSSEVGAFVELDQSVIAAADGRGVQVGMTGISFDVERFGSQLLDPPVAAGPLSLRRSRKNQNRSR